MGVHVLWPLAFLALIPVILLLYFLKQQVKQKEFSATMLWREAYRSVEANRPWEKLKKNILLILQIVIVGLFVLTLMGFWLSAKGSSASLTILVLDNSASMGTLYDGEETRLEAAKELACEYVDRMSDGGSVYVISGNDRAALELGGSTDRIEAKNRIRSLEQTNLAGDLSGTLGLVQSCLSQADDADIVFFTDTAFDTAELDARVESFYSETENAAVTALNTKQTTDALQVLAQVTNYGTKEADFEVNLYGSDSETENLLTVQSVTVAAGESEPVYFELENDLLQQGIVSLRAEINESDALAADNEAWCVLQEQRESQVLLLTSSNLFLEKAFQNISGVNIYRTSDVGVFDTAEAAGYDLYIFDGMLPEQLPTEGSLMFWGCQPGTFAEVTDTLSGQELEICDTDVTTYAANATFGVNETACYATPTWGTDLVTAGSASAGFYGIYGGQRMVCLGFDLHQSDFGLQAEFPILISELADYLLDGSMTEKTSYSAGDNILIHGNSGGSDMELVWPDQTSETISAGEAAGTYITGTQLGVYQLTQTLQEETNTQWFAVQFPGQTESSVTPATTMLSDENAAGDGLSGVRELRSLFLILLLIVMGAEWLIYTRTS